MTTDTHGGEQGKKNERMHGSSMHEAYSRRSEALEQRVGSIAALWLRVKTA
jgi:hypothetical protein